MGIFDLIEQHFLAVIAKRVPNRSTSRDKAVHVVERLHNQRLLEGVAKNAVSRYARFAAIRRVNNCNLLAEIVQHERNESIRSVALSRLEELRRKPAEGQLIPSSQQNQHANSQPVTPQTDSGFHTQMEEPTPWTESAAAIFLDPHSQASRTVDQGTFPVTPNPAESDVSSPETTLQFPIPPAPARSTPHYDVFISFKNLAADGTPTRDSMLARTIYAFLTEKHLSVFLSNISLEQLGVSAYKRAIDDALDAAQVLVAVGTSCEHLDSEWVRYEWDSFFNEILSGQKPQGRVFVYLDGTEARSLPRPLRQTQIIMHASGALDRLYNFIANARR